MGFDIRLPIGFLFVTLGVLLSLFGLVTLQSPIYERSLGLNINLVWGIVMLLFGLLMAYFARRSRNRQVREEVATKTSKG
jgi:hypothetical protein